MPGRETQLSQGLTKHDAMKTYEEVEAQLHILNLGTR
jgi:hypothetical protein